MAKEDIIIVDEESHFKRNGRIQGKHQKYREQQKRRFERIKEEKG